MKLMRSVLAVSLALAAGQALAQAPVPGKAIDVTRTDIETTIQTMAAGDMPIRMVNTRDMNVGVAIVKVAKTPPGRIASNGQQHHDVTEIYYVLRGAGTLVTDSEIENPVESAPDAINTRTHAGPTSSGQAKGGKTRKIAAGDVIIVPPNTTHYLAQVTDEIVYIIYRLDPKKLVEQK